MIPIHVVPFVAAPVLLLVIIVRVRVLLLLLLLLLVVRMRYVVIPGVMIVHGGK